MNNIKNNRIASLDLLKLFAIFLVLWGHSLQHMTTDNFENDNLYHFIYSFHMSLFILVSGYFAPSRMSDLFTIDTIHLIKKESIRYLLPCASWGVIIYLILSIVHNDFQFLGIFEFIIFHVLWFLKTVFICIIFGYLTKYHIIGCIISLFIPIYGFQWLYPVFYIGKQLKANWNFIQKYTLSALLISGLLFVLWLLFADNYSPHVDYSHFLSDSKYLVDDMNSIFNILAGGISGSLFFFLLFRYLKGGSQKIAKYGGWTLGVYSLQTLTLEYGLGNFVNISNCINTIHYWLLTFIVSCFMLFINLFFVGLIRQITILRLFLLGRN